MKIKNYVLIVVSALILGFVFINDKKVDKTDEPKSRTVDVNTFPKCKKEVVERWQKDKDSNSQSFLYERMIISKDEFLYFNTSDGTNCKSLKE